MEQTFTEQTFTEQTFTEQTFIEKKSDYNYTDERRF